VKFVLAFFFSLRFIFISPGARFGIVS